MNTFTAGSCIKFGWETFKKRSWFFIGAILLALVVYGIVVGVASSFVSGTGTPMTLTSSFINFVVAVIRFVAEILLAMGLIAFFIKAHDATESVRISDFWHPNPFWKYTGSTILVGILVIIGTILIIVPGIFAAIVFMFAGYFVIDRGLGPIQSMKESARITKGHRWELFVLFLFTLVITIVGAICLLVGLLVTIPVTALAVVHAYRTLSQSAGTPASVSVA